MRAPELTPKPLPPRGWPLGKAPLPFDGCGAGPLAPPPTTAVGGEPNVRGADAVEPMYWLNAAPVERLIAELHVEIAARAEKIDARRAERWRGVGLREIKEAGARVARVGDRDVEPAVGGLHV